jgi:type I restriction enzyme S subunit
LKKSELVDHGVPVLGIENVLNNRMAWTLRRFVSPAKFEQLADYAVRPGDILITTMGTIGRAAVVPDRKITAIIDSHLFRMRVDSQRILPRYLAYALNSGGLTRQLDKKSRGAIMDGLNTTILKECVLRVPSIREQEIALTALDAASKVARMRSFALEMNESLLRAVFLEMFGDPIANLLNFPVIDLGAACNKIIDYRGRTPEYSVNGIPHVTAACIKKGLIGWNACKYVSSATFEEYMTRGLPEFADVLFTTEAPLGESAVVRTNNRFSLAQRLVLFRPKPTLDPDYLSFLLGLTEFRPALLRYATGTTVKGVSSENLQSVSIPIPPLELQKQFARIATEHQRVIRANLESVRQAEHLFQTLLHEAFGEAA